MELTPALNDKVTKAIQAALKDVNPRPAVDRLVAARTSGKWARYAQFLAEWPGEKFGCIYVGLTDEGPKVTIHEPGSKGAQRVARLETIRRRKQEARLRKAEGKAQELKPKKERKPKVPKAEAAK